MDAGTHAAIPQGFRSLVLQCGISGLVVSGRLRGTEPVEIVGASAHGTISFALPGIAAPLCRVGRLGQDDAVIRTELDTVILDTDSDRLTLWFRGRCALREGPHDVRSIVIRHP